MRDYFRRNAIALVGQLASIAQSVLLIPLFVRTAGAATYGEWALVSSLLGLLYGVLPLGTGFRVARYLPTTTDPAAARALVYPQFIFQVSIVCLLGAPILVLVKAFSADTQGAPSWWLGVLYLVSYVLFAQSNSYLRFTNRIFACTVQGTLGSAAQVAAAIVMAAAGHLSVAGLIAVQSAILALVAAPVLVLMVREIGGPVVWPSVSVVRGDIALGFPITVTIVVDTVLAVGDRYILAGYLPLADVGAYAAAYTVGMLPLIFPRAVGMVLPQIMSAAVDSGVEARAHHVMEFTLGLFVFVGVPFVVGSWLVGADVLGFFTDRQVAARAAGVLPLVAIASLAYGTCLLLSQVLFVQLRTGTMLYANGVAAAANIVLNVVLLRLFGSVLVPAVVTIVCYLFMLLIMLRRVRESWPVSVGYPVLRVVGVATAAMAVALAAARATGLTGHLPGLIGVIVAAVLIYCVISLQLGVRDVLRLRAHQPAAP